MVTHEKFSSKGTRDAPVDTAVLPTRRGLGGQRVLGGWGRQLAAVDGEAEPLRCVAFTRVGGGQEVGEKSVD